MDGRKNHAMKTSPGNAGGIRSLKEILSSQGGSRQKKKVITTGDTAKAVLDIEKTGAEKIRRAS